MEQLVLVLAVPISLVAIVLAARRAVRRAPPPPPSDDPHAGLLAELAWQRGPRIYG
jgi:hypothetical protein